MIIVDRGGGGDLNIISQSKRALKLTRGLGPDGSLDEDSMRRLTDTIRDFVAVAKSARAGEIVFAATSFLRDATNGEEIVRRVREETGAEIRVLTSDEEARHACLGAAYGLPVDSGVAVDIGGRSAEIVELRDRRMARKQVFPLGALRVSDEFLRSDPPSKKELTALRRHAEATLESALGKYSLDGGMLVGTGGTIRNLAKIDRRRRGYTFSRLHGYKLTGNRLAAIIKDLASRERGRRRQVPGLNPARTDSIVGGAVVLDTIIQALGARSIIISGDGLREGLALDLPGDSLPDVVAVRESSITALSSRFGSWRPDSARRCRNVALALVEAASPDTPEELRNLMGYAAQVLEAGSSMDYYNRFSHAASIVELSDLRGFLHAEIAFMAGSLQMAGRNGSDLERYADAAGKRRSSRLPQAAAILETADEVARRLSVDAEDSLHARREAGVLTVSAAGLEAWSERGLERRFANALGISLRVRGAVA
ncbi:MAG: Ppx/GppA phosphatase family protein [Chloroflexi bacterium]|nr:Ppx/GppA phosphatase family protein [Chloroflexota bacterium]MCY3939259.1 Ppx/GppA phosphatase family protein [Chloroflexota bacterium]